MEAKDKEEIRQAVRERYGEIARTGPTASGIGPGASCCGQTDNIAEFSQADSCGCCGSASSVEKRSYLENKESALCF